MTLSDLAALGSFVSGIAVLVSLVYVSMQIRQATKHTRAQIAQSRTDRLVEIQLRLAESDYVDLFARGVGGDETLSTTEIRRFMAWSRALFGSMEETFTQHRDGMLPDSMFLTLSKGFVGTMRGAGMQASWHGRRTQYAPDFMAYMDNIAAEARAAGYGEARVQQWVADVARFKESGGQGASDTEISQ